MPRFFTLPTLLLCMFSLVRSQSLKLAAKHQGASFFDGWTANATDHDPTNSGNVKYLDTASAKEASLLFVNSAGNAIVKVDNTTNDPSPGPDSQFGRNTVTIISQETIDLGTLVIMDAVHLPFGCSVWPAFWTLDSVTHSDEGGEIDIIEYVNMMPNNQFTLHAKEGCKLVKDDSMPFTGTETSDDCNYNYNITGNKGCGATSSDAAKSVGQAFAQNGGGVYAMYWSTEGISMWFFQRSDIPADITSETPNPKSWNTPIASFSASGCNPRSFFNPQNMIINIDICGNWALPAFDTTGCSGKCTDLVAKASNYDNAYWEIKYIKTFTDSTFGHANSTTAGKAGAASGTTSAGASDETAKSAGDKIHRSLWIAGLGAILGSILLL